MAIRSVFETAAPLEVARLSSEPRERARSRTAVDEELWAAHEAIATSDQDEGWYGFAGDSDDDWYFDFAAENRALASHARAETLGEDWICFCGAVSDELFDDECGQYAYRDRERGDGAEELWSTAN